MKQLARVCAQELCVFAAAVLLACFWFNYSTNTPPYHAQLLDGATQKDPVRYCIDWDFKPPEGAKKSVNVTARAPTTGKWVTLRSCGCVHGGCSRQAGRQA